MVGLHIVAQSDHAGSCTPPNAPTVDIRTGAWSSGRRGSGLMNHAFFSITWMPEV